MHLMRKQITMDKLKVYQKYQGDPDSFARTGSNYEKNLIGDEDWRIIEELYHNFFLIKNNLTSKEFSTEILIHLEQVADDDVINSLIK